ncbi:MAG: winged helix-turn-helix domain-containing protein [Pseudomonadota bacterium]
MTSTSQPDEIDAKRRNAMIAREMTALSHPRRVAIFTVLNEADRGLSFEELMARTKLSTSTLSHHLRPMKAAGLIASRRQGARVSMTLARDRFGDGVRGVMTALTAGAA